MPGAQHDMRIFLMGAALSAPLFAQTPAPDCVPIGTWHAASGTLIPESDITDARVIYDNTCPTGQWVSLCGSEVLIDWGRLPAPNTPEVAGDQANYLVDGFTIAFATSELDPSHGGSGTNVFLYFYESYLPCTQVQDLPPQPTGGLSIFGLPGAAPGQTAFYELNVDLRGTFLPWCMRAEGDGVYDGDATDYFAWSFRVFEPTGPFGLIVAGDPTICAPGKDTGTGLGNTGEYVLSHYTEPCSTQPAYCHTMEPAPWTGFHLRLYSSTEVTCTDPGEAFCFGTNCHCGNLDPEAGCANLLGSGARLTGIGSSSLQYDQFVLRADGIPPGKAALLIAGPEVADIQLGSGNLCVGPWVRRLGSPQTLPSEVRLFGPGILAQNEPVFGGLEVGDSWNFQVWYRDEPACSLGGSSNFTNGLRVVFTP